MLDRNSEARLLEVHPKLAQKIRTLAETLLQEGIEIRVTQGFRTWAQQHALWLQGRAPVDDVNACRLNCGMQIIPEHQNRRVTKADSGQSWHCYGMAIDVAPFRNGLPIWDETDPAWARIIAIGEALGMRSGTSWGDEPHFELTGKWGPVPGPEVIQLYQDANVGGSGTQAVWDAAEIA